MKHTDLMLNDLVMFQGKILRVGCISDYDIKIDLFEDGEDTPYAEIWQKELDEVEPIPLTAEILEKNGFEKSNQISDTPPYYMDEEGNIFYSFEQNHFWGWWHPDNVFEVPANAMGWISIKYVHELQHALRLCGIDKEIVL